MSDSDRNVDIINDILYMYIFENLSVCLFVCLCDCASVPNKLLNHATQWDQTLHEVHCRQSKIFRK